MLLTCLNHSGSLVTTLQRETTENKHRILNKSPNKQEKCHIWSYFLFLWIELCVLHTEILSSNLNPVNFPYSQILFSINYCCTVEVQKQYKPQYSTLAHQDLGTLLFRVNFTSQVSKKLVPSLISWLFSSRGSRSSPGCRADKHFYQFDVENNIFCS